jgi:hypothetical protein
MFYSVNVTESHYAPFVKRRQQLEVYGRLAWDDSAVEPVSVQADTPSGTKPAPAQIN